MPIIIIEGVDGSGKSTLANAIAKLDHGLTVDLQHRGPLKNSVQVEYYWPLVRVPDDVLLIADRWHLGEMIYGPLYRGASLVDGTWFEAIEDVLETKQAGRVIMSPPLDIVKHRLSARGEDYLKPEHVEHVWNEYRSPRFDDWLRFEDLHVGDELTDAIASRILNLALNGDF